MLLCKPRGRASEERAIRARGLSATYISDSGPCDLGVFTPQINKRPKI